MLQYCPEREKEANKIQEKEKKKLWPEKNSYLKEQQPVPVRTPPYKRSQVVLWEREHEQQQPLSFACSLNVIDGTIVGLFVLMRS